MSRVPEVRVAAVGDVALCGPFIRTHCPAGAPLTYPFDPLGSTLNGTDLLLINLEGPLSSHGPRRSGRTALLYNEIEILDWLAQFPNCVCSLANNHIMDFGVEALIATRERLQERGIRFVGAGLNENEAARPVEITIDGLSISVFAFTSDEAHVGSVIATPSSPGCCGLPSIAFATGLIADAAAKSDAVIVLLHTGFEFHTYPTVEQTLLARALVDHGATLVIGHHPHVQQGTESIRNALICHSLGNLLLPEILSASGRLQYRKPATKQFAILKARVSRKAVQSWSLTGGTCDRKYRLQPFQGRKSKSFERHMSELSLPLSRGDYSTFAANYSKQRKSQLRREAVRDAIAKLLRTDPKALLRTLTVADLTRNLSRLFGFGHK